MELELETDRNLAQLQAAGQTDEDMAAKIRQDADEVHARQFERYEARRGRLPVATRRLTAG